MYNYAIAMCTCACIVQHAYDAHKHNHTHTYTFLSTFRNANNMLAHVLQCSESIEYVMAVVQGHAYAQLCSHIC